MKEWRRKCSLRDVNRSSLPCFSLLTFIPNLAIYNIAEVVVIAVAGVVSQELGTAFVSIKLAETVDPRGNLFHIRGPQATLRLPF